LKTMIVTVTALALSALWTGPGEAQRSQQAKRQIDGHSKLSRERMKRLHSGKHHIHTHRSGHKSHVILKKGKVADMHVTDRKGRKVQLSKKVVRRRGGPVSLAFPDALIAHLDGEGPENGGRVVATGVQVRVFVVWSFRDPILNRLVLFIWPIESVAGGADPDNGDTDEFSV
jgi:hypothetical protein